jgi:hypothetical protein
MTTYERLIQEGEQRGLQKGGSRILIRQLSRRFPGNAAQLTPLLDHLSPEQQEELGEKILDASGIEEIREWLESVCRN